jgi:PAS domain S-box-containing protein
MSVDDPRENDRLLNERFLELFLEQTPVAAAMFDREMRYLAASGRWLDEHGWGAAGRGRGRHEHFPQTSERLGETLRRALGGEALKLEEDRFERADGAVRWLRWEARPWREAGGAIGGIIVFADDVTERRRAEDALREKEQQLSADLDAMTRLQRIGTLFVHDRNLEPILGEIVDAAMAISAADFGNIQIVNASAELLIVAQRGFPDWWVDFWNSPQNRGCCAVARERNERVIVEDVENSPIFAGGPGLKTLRKVGVRAVQSTPLVSRSGKLLGIFSTHYRARRRPCERALRHLDLLARQAADIIERAQIEDALEQSRQDFVRAQQVGQIGWWRLDTTRGVLTGSDETHRMFGVPKGTPLSYQSFLAAVHPDDREFVREQWTAALMGEPYDIEHRIVVDGQVRWIREKAYLEYDGSGGLLGGFGITQDISEQKRAQQKTFEAQRRLQAIMHAVPVGISYSDDASCQRITGNSAVLSQFEIGPTDNISASAADAEAAGRKVRFFHDGREIADYELPLQRAVAEAREIPPMELEVLLASGRRWFTAASGAPIIGEQGEILGGVAVTVDVTERRNAEEALRENDRRKDEFIATLSHELRNPLAPIRNAIFLLRKLDGGSLGERSRSLIAMVERQVNHLIRLVDDLLEASRISTGKIKLMKQPVDLADVIRHAIETCEPLISDGRHELSLSLSGELIVDGDSMRLTQVFANVLNNSAKYTPAGGKIEVSTMRSEDDAVVCVRDNGAGISRDMLPRIFELFVQSSQPAGAERSGIGVGLAIARRLVEMHGGHIEGHSEGVDCGSEFVVRLPLVAGSPDEKQERTPASVATAGRVLIVDDIPEVADSLVMLLETLGADVRAVHDGEAALAAVVEFRPQLALVDIGMPKMDGYETARRIRLLPEGRDLVLAALSGWGREEDRRRALAAGFNHHFLKPIDIEALEKLLNSGAVGG